MATLTWAMPFNSIGGDRRYNADDMAQWNVGMYTDGVHPDGAENLKVTAAGGFTISVAPGRCSIRGRWGYSAAAVALGLEAPNGSLPRYDRVVLRLDIMARRIDVIVKTGAPDSNPIAPGLRRDAEAWELSLANIYVAPTAESITAGMIGDERPNTQLCGFVRPLVNTQLSQMEFARTMTVTGNYTLTGLDDYGRMILADSHNPITITVPNLVIPDSVNPEVEICQMGVGRVTVAAGAGVTILSDNGANKTMNRYGVCALKQLSQGVWLLAGALS